MRRKIITEQCGAEWYADRTTANGSRSYWVWLVSGRSFAKPNYIGFYAASIEAACNALNN